ncbi:MAG: bifunctional phosphoribosylaminoimidazolecarboxamide formyltransferase/IMP cyclohydrolase [Bdellovibrionaceae bacterium]|jgi:phosphoribosylaminoimidazolecarboxamide formyltransferase / IMP cyclohydrolase|nr:bifunctional phosphoribosylaminoimidazolecarboxamide formyltransferase/IMP cyclohydrolase [Pseudobdellovibrionaceae bacterium]
MKKFNRALVSVSNKSGLGEFIKQLHSEGTEIVSTGGTAKYLRDQGVEVQDVSSVTGFPEVMNGRVKTLHPKIHMGLLARAGHQGDEQTLNEFEVEMFDLVVGNLYPFEEVLKNKSASEEDKIENIDIGGPSFLRSAAKNFTRITTICDPNDYEKVLQSEKMSLDQNKALAAKVFSHTSVYDSMISKSLGIDFDNIEFSVGGKNKSQLRYGENPSQKATWFQMSGAVNGLHEANLLQGKALSYNNLLDLDAAVTTLREFSSEPSCVSVKHLNPCGVGLGNNTTEAIEHSLKADPKSVFGGIVAVNGQVDEFGAEKLCALFLECVIATSFTDQAKEKFKAKKNLRVLEWPEILNADPSFKFKNIDGGFLVQNEDQTEVWSPSWKIIGEEPSDAVKKSIALAWKVCAHLKSNAIAISSDVHTLGLGMGQVNRVDAVEQAISRYEGFHPEANNIVLASDAFFPFADSIERIAKSGVKWVVQPGGSIKDDEVLAAAKKLNITLILTGKRHFNH